MESLSWETSLANFERTTEWKIYQEQKRQQEGVKWTCRVLQEAYGRRQGEMNRLS